MGLETSFQYIDDLNASWPVGSQDYVDKGDNHLQGIKAVLKNQLGSLGRSVLTATANELNKLHNCTTSTSELNLLAGRTLSADNKRIDCFEGAGDNKGNAAVCLFRQTAAPTGWTKWTSSTYNNRALRVVTSTVGIGGVIDFSIVFGRTTTDPHLLTAAESGVPAHGHAYRHDDTNQTSVNSTSDGGLVTSGTGVNYAAWDGVPAGAIGRHIGVNPTENAQTAHTHGCNMQVKYTDVILATKS